MTGRGAAGAPPLRPTTPPDPTLASRPVPHKQSFPIRSFGAGANFTSAYDFTDRRAKTDFWDALHRDAPADDGDPSENGSLLDTIKQWEAVTWRDDQELTPQPTWGYYVFLTDYAQETRDALPQAMENWVRAIQRGQRANTEPPNPLAQEVMQRLRLDLVEDKDNLQNASSDRVRECFRALVRSFELSDREDDWVPPTRHTICFVLDARAVQMLAGLTFSDDRMEEYRALARCRVQAVDITWDRPETTRSSWRGVRDVSVIGLARLYHMSAGGGFTLEDSSE